MRQRVLVDAVDEMRLDHRTALAEELVAQSAEERRPVFDHLIVNVVVCTHQVVQHRIVQAKIVRLMQAVVGIVGIGESAMQGVVGLTRLLRLAVLRFVTDAQRLLCIPDFGYVAKISI